MGTGQHPLKFGGLNPQPETLVHFVDLCQGGLICSLLTQLDHHPDIVGLTGQRIPA